MEHSPPDMDVKRLPLMEQDLRGRKIVMASWLLVLTASIGFCLAYRDVLNPESISEFLKQTHRHVMISYLLICMARGLLLLPNTPLILAGILLFPQNMLAVYLLNITGRIFSSAVIYYFSDYLGFDRMFEGRYPGKISMIRKKMDSPGGILFVILWAFFPLVPTDVVCYVAGSVRMNVMKFLAAVFLGESILVTCYTWAGSKLSLLF